MNWESVPNPTGPAFHVNKKRRIKEEKKKEKKLSNPFPPPSLEGKGNLLPQNKESGVCQLGVTVGGDLGNP